MGDKASEVQIARFGTKTWVKLWAGGSLNLVFLCDKCGVESTKGNNTS